MGSMDGLRFEVIGNASLTIGKFTSLPKHRFCNRFANLLVELAQRAVAKVGVARRRQRRRMTE